MRFTELTIPIYDMAFTIVIAKKDKDVLEQFPNLPPQGKPFATTYANHRNLKNLTINCIYVVLNPLHKSKCFGLGTIAHEAFHVVEFVFENIGEGHIVNSEAKAYLLEWVVDRIAEFVYLKTPKNMDKGKNKIFFKDTYHVIKS